MQLENKYLQIEGIVEKSVLSKLINAKKYTKRNTKWLFVDYAPYPYEINSTFNVIMEGADKKMLPHIYNIKLLNAVDQFGNHLDSIQQGWKTICRFEFVTVTPQAVKSLPVLSTWQYNKNSLKIANSQDLIIDSNYISKNAYGKVINEWLSFAMHSHSVDGKDFMQLFLKVYEENRDELKDKLPPSIISDAKKKLHTIDH